MVSLLTTTAALLAVLLTGMLTATAFGLRLEHRFAQAKLSDKGGFSR